MPASGWLADTRASYDSVAVSHADHVRDALAGCTVEAQMPLDVDGSRSRGGPLRACYRYGCR
jgi:hypothetical protein